MRDALIAIVSLGLAWLTYVFIEEPVRSRQLAISWSKFKVLGMGAAASLLVIGLAQGVQAHAHRLGEGKGLGRLAQAQEDHGWSRRRCRQPKRSDKLIPMSKCIGAHNAKGRLLMVWGDSHADHAVGMLEAAAGGHRIAILPRWKSGCPPLLGIEPIKANRPEENCTQFNDAVLREVVGLQQAGRLVGVVLSARWSMYLNTPSLAGDDGAALRHDGRLIQAEGAVSALSHGLRSTLQALTARGVNVLVIAPLPEQRFEVPACLARRSFEECSVLREIAETRRAPALVALQGAIKDSDNTSMWDPWSLLCDERRCHAERNSMVLYIDDEHLTYTGSRWLGDFLRQDPAWHSLLGDGPLRPH
jgi:hypothetical protein